MYNKSTNPRVTESMDMISDAFYHLLTKDDYSAITIMMICDAAGVARKTFYRNFETKEDILEYIYYKKFKTIEYTKKGRENFFDTLHNFYDFWYHEKQFLDILYKNKMLYILTNIFDAQSYVFPFDKRNFNFNYNTDFDPYFFEMMTASAVKMVEIWTKRGFKESTDELVDLYHQFFTTPVMLSIDNQA